MWKRIGAIALGGAALCGWATPLTAEVATGIQIHGPDGATFVAPRQEHIVVDGEPLST